MRPSALLALLLATQTIEAADSAVLLMYHRFGEDRYPSTSVRLEQFEKHLEHLSTAGYSVVPLERVLDFVRTGRPLPDRAVSITVDDAYRSVYEEAYPRLLKRGFPFTVFVSTDAVDNGFPDFMTWDQLREMGRNGVAIANHGAAHESLLEGDAGETEIDRRERVKLDIEKGWQRLSEELQPLPGVFAYPYGEFDVVSAEVIAGLGYAGFGQHSGAVGPLTDLRSIPRFPIAEPFAELEEFRVKVASLPLAVVSVEPWNPVTREARPRLIVNLGTGGAALDRLSCFASGQGQVEVHWTEKGKQFFIEATEPFRPGRQRYNCTAPAPTSGRFYWFSQSWVIR